MNSNEKKDKQEYWEKKLERKDLEKWIRSRSYRVIPPLVFGFFLVLYTMCAGFFELVFTHKNVIFSMSLIFMLLLFAFLALRSRKKRADITRNELLRYDKVIFRKKLRIYSPVFGVLICAIMLLLIGYFFYFGVVSAVQVYFLKNELTGVLLIAHCVALILFLTYLKVRSFQNFYIGLNSSGIFVRDGGFICWKDVKFVSLEWPRGIIMGYVCLFRDLEKEDALEVGRWDSEIPLDELLGLIEQFRELQM